MKSIVLIGDPEKAATFVEGLANRKVAKHRHQYLLEGDTLSIQYESDVNKLINNNRFGAIIVVAANSNEIPAPILHCLPKLPSASLHIYADSKQVKPDDFIKTFLRKIEVDRSQSLSQKLFCTLFGNNQPIRHKRHLKFQKMVNPGSKMSV